MNGIADLPVPADGTCLVCGGPRRLEKIKQVYREAMRTDPFCSNVCCRDWYGVPLPSTARVPGAYTSALPATE